MVLAMLLTAIGATEAQQIVISTFEGETPHLASTQRIMDRAYEQLGITMVVKQFPGERAIQNANDGDVDGELYRKPGIEVLYPNLVGIPVNILSVDFVVFTKETQFPVKGWESLRPYRVGYMRGVKAVEANLAEVTWSEAVATYKQAFQKLVSGRSDVVIASRQRGLLALKTLGLSDITILEPPLITIKSFHYLHVKNRHLVEPLTAVLQQMDDDGALQKIHEQVNQKWLQWRDPSREGDDLR